MPNDAGLLFTVRDGKLCRKQGSHNETSLQPVAGDSDALSASDLVQKLCHKSSAGASETESDTNFTVTLHENHLTIEPTTPESNPGALIIEGSWTVETDPKKTSTADQFIIHGADELLGFLLDAAVAQRDDSTAIDLNRARLLNGQLDKLCQLIKSSWWTNLTRSITISNAALSKIDQKLLGDDPRPRIYIPEETPEQFRYYSQLSDTNPDIRLEVLTLPPPPLSPEFIQSLNGKPGLLALAMDDRKDDDKDASLSPLPYVVPGGRFNELYGWDTYFTVLGLLEDDFTDLCAAILKNFCFCIEHYGKIFNANRTYYLGRSQPPFLTSIGTAVLQKMDKTSLTTIQLAQTMLFAALKEYYTVWMAGEHLDKKTGLSRYHGEGKGFPPECEPHHFDDEIGHIAVKHGMSLEDFAKAYDSGEVQDEELDEYLEHDRAGRESGHDTTYRFVGRAAHLATVDLNSCLHKYETDIASLLDLYFDGKLEIPPARQLPGMLEYEDSATWVQRAATRRDAMTKFLWSPDKGTFVDYDTVNHVQMSYDNATVFWPLWAKVATPAQAESIVKSALPKLETYGGVMASTELARGEVSPERPQRQWDYPYGWAPHQMLAWAGLSEYGFMSDAERLMYRWVSMVTKTFTNHNGLVVEKYDVTSKDKSHVVEAEYGNQGSDFSSDVQTGFAWTNASVICGARQLRGH